MTKNPTPVVAFVSDAIHPYNHGGKELRIHEITHRISDRSQVHVYTMQWWAGSKLRVDGGVTYHAVSRLFPLYTKNRRSIAQAIGFAFGCLRLLTHDFDALEADHIPYIQIIVLRLVATLKRRRLVVTWHEVWGRTYWRKYLGMTGRLAWFVEWLTLRLPDHIIVVSPQTADRILAILGDRASISVVPTGIDLKELRSARPEHPVTDIVTVGRLLDHKRVDMLLDALALLHSEGQFATCRVIGDGPEREALHRQACELGISDLVEFRHDVAEQKELHSLLKSARIFVFPSAREGLGLAVLEALACGLPVVTTSSPDNLAQHLVTRSSQGVVCQPAAADIAEAVSRLLKQPSHSAEDQASREVDAWLSEYSLDTMVDRVAEALRI